MTNLAYDVVRALSGYTVSTAESCTGGMIGSALTAIPGSSSVYKGGVVSYTNEVKQKLLGVESNILEKYGAVSSQVATAMAVGVRNSLNTDVAIAVTGLAGPGGDDFGNPIGTVYIGYADANKSFSVECNFKGDREAVRLQSVRAALQLLRDMSEKLDN